MAGSGQFSRDNHRSNIVLTRERAVWIMIHMTREGNDHVYCQRDRKEMIFNLEH